jgi:hypothetical protein
LYYPGKFLLFIILIFLFTTNAFTQVLLTPTKANGFAVWTDTHPDVRFWEVSIFERTPLTDSTHQDVRVWRHEEWHNNIIFIPEEFRPEGIINKFGIFLTGWNASHQPIIEEAIVPFLEAGGGSHPWLESCYVVCNSSDYAWKLQQLLPTNGSFGPKYQLGPASHFNPELEEFVPYYEFMTWDYFYNVFVTNEQYHTSYYNIFGWIEHIIMATNNDLNNPYKRTIINSESIIYRDKYGAVISDATFVGIRKAMGNWNHIWNNYNESFTIQSASDPLAGNHLCAINTPQWAVSYFNAYAEYTPIPLLNCVPHSYPASEPEWSGLQICFDLLPSQFLNEWNFTSFIECLGTVASGSGSGGNQNPWSDIIEISIEEIKKDGSYLSAFNLKQAQIFDPNGDFIPFSFSLSPGLYNITIIHAGFDSFFIERIFEIKEPSTFGVTYADHFDFSIYPVPHIDDSFTINMNCSANLNFEYKLFDFSGNILHKSNYNLRKEHDENHFIEPSLPLPSGLLLHRFEFKDNSNKTAITIKN